MTLRENTLAVLNYEKFDHFPVVAFGFWRETLEKWAQEGHIPMEWAKKWGDNSPADKEIMKRLGFDYNWYSLMGGNVRLLPPFEPTVLEEKADGSQIMRDKNGLIVQVKPGISSIPAEIGTSLVDRKAWEELYLPRLQWDESRVKVEKYKALPPAEERELPLGLHCGSLIGYIRDLLGVQQLSYLYADDEDLYVEIIDTFGNLCYRFVETVMKTGAQLDYAHFWEDICYKNGPLVSPGVFEEYVAPHYKRITDLLKTYDINLVSVDCDGMIDHILPYWIENGVNTMFPIEVGTWNASIAPWREKYGRELRGVGGMNKTVFSKDYKAVDAEIERLKPLIELGGFIPCPDHRIAPDAKFENVQYYCDKMQNLKL